MPKLRLIDIAHGRSGDKGNNANIAVIAREEKHYPTLVRLLTAEVVKERFKDICLGKVERYELPNLFALNFVLYDCLDGGGTISLRSDAQGKTLISGLLKMELEA